MRNLLDVLTVERVQLAYKRQGATPVRTVWIGLRHEPRCACPATVVALDEGMDEFELRQAELDQHGVAPSELIGRTLDVDPGHVRAFADGFDGKHVGASLRAHHPEAWERGREVAAAVLP